MIIHGSHKRPFCHQVAFEKHFGSEAKTTDTVGISKCCMFPNVLVSIHNKTSGRTNLLRKRFTLGSNPGYLALFWASDRAAYYIGSSWWPRGHTSFKATSPTTYLPPTHNDVSSLEHMGLWDTYLLFTISFIAAVCQYSQGGVSRGRSSEAFHPALCRSPASQRNLTVIDF